MAEDPNKPSTLDFGKDILEELTEIHLQRDTILGKMKNAEEKRSTVSPSVFSKVMAEFQENLDELDRSFNKRAEHLKDILKELWEKKSKLSADCVKLEHELEEIDFKFSIGELGNDDYEKGRAQKSADIDTKQTEIRTMDTFIHSSRNLIVDRKITADAAAKAEEAGAVAPDAEASPKSGPTERLEEAKAPAQAAQGDEIPSTAEIPVRRGSENPILVIRDKDNREETYEIPPGITLIGRSPENDIILLESKISRRHARITREGPACTMEDLGSSNGTWLNGDRMEGNKPYTLTENDLLKIGQTVAWFRIES